MAVDFKIQVLKGCKCSFSVGSQTRVLLWATCLLWWDVKRNSSQIHFHNRISAWQNEENSCLEKGEEKQFFKIKSYFFSVTAARKNSK